jgi:hypothetical protein
MFGSLLRWPSRPSVLATMALGLAVPAGLLASAMPAMAAPHFTISQLVALPGAASNLAVVSTSSTTEEVFYVPQNGSVQEKYFSELVGPLLRKVRATKCKVEVGAGLLTTGGSRPGHWLTKSRSLDHVELRMAVPGFQELVDDDVCRRSRVAFSSWRASGSTPRRFPRFSTGILGPRRRCIGRTRGLTGGSRRSPR